MWISLMYILTIKGKESKGAYSVVDQDNDQVLYMFENKIVKVIVKKEIRYRFSLRDLLIRYIQQM